MPQHYNHIANENKAKNEEALRKWIKSYTPEEIRKAHNARRSLVRLGVRSRYKDFLIGLDDRQVRQPVTSYARFFKERMATGDYKGMSGKERFQLISHEWKELDEAVKQVSLEIRQPTYAFNGLMANTLIAAEIRRRVRPRKGRRGSLVQQTLFPSVFFFHPKSRSADPHLEAPGLLAPGGSLVVMDFVRTNCFLWCIIYSRVNCRTPGYIRVRSDCFPQA